MKNLIIIMIVLSALFARRGDPTDDLPNGHIDGAVVSWVNGYTLSVGLTNTTSTLKDSTGRYDISFNNALSVVLTNSNVAGQYGGLARSITLASNTLYYVYVISGVWRGPEFGNTYAIVTTNATEPEWKQTTVTNTQWDGTTKTTNTYDIPFAYRRVGAFLTWGTNSTVQAAPFTYVGNGQSRVCYTTSSKAIYGNALPNTGSNTTMTAAPLKVPSTASAIIGNVVLTNVAIATFSSKYNTIATDGISMSATGGGGALAVFPVVLPISGSALLYKTSAAADVAILYVAGWKEEL